MILIAVTLHIVATILELTIILIRHTNNPTSARDSVSAQHAKRRTLFMCLFSTFFCQFFKVLKPLPTENKKKTEATVKQDINKTPFFVLLIFSNSVRKSFKMAETCPKRVKIQIFGPLVTKI